MFESRLGEFAALMTAFCWTFGAMSFEKASKRSGSLSVNLIRLVIGFVFISLFCLIYRGMLFPVDASAHAWKWLALSGLVGFAFGDLFLFRAFILIGSRISMLMMSAVPPITALIGWLILGEKLSSKGFIGMALTIFGIALVVLVRKKEENGKRLSHPVKGVLIAFGGALGQSIGLVLSKYGMGQFDPFAATQIRILAGTIGFTIFFILLKRWPLLLQAVRDRTTLKYASIGAVLGPFLGVSFSLLAVQHTTTGIASTIMAIVPVLIIPPAIILLKEKVTFREIIGALIAVAGVSVLFL